MPIKKSKKALLLGQTNFLIKRYPYLKLMPQGSNEPMNGRKSKDGLSYITKDKNYRIGGIAENTLVHKGRR